jgi:hypothetical protein
LVRGRIPPGPDSPWPWPAALSHSPDSLPLESTHMVRWKGTETLNAQLEGKQYKNGLNDLIKCTVVRPNDLDAKAFNLLDEIEKRGRAAEACQHLRQAMEGIARDKVSNWRAYVHTLLRDFDEELEDMPQEEKERDPLHKAMIRREVGGQTFTGIVEDIEIGKFTREVLYRIRYTDGDIEHFTRAQLAELEDKSAAAKPVPMQRPACNVCEYFDIFDDELEDYENDGLLEKVGKKRNKKRKKKNNQNDILEIMTKEGLAAEVRLVKPLRALRAFAAEVGLVKPLRALRALVDDEAEDYKKELEAKTPEFDNFDDESEHYKKELDAKTPEYDGLLEKVGKKKKKMEAGDNGGGIIALILPLLLLCGGFVGLVKLPQMLFIKKTMKEIAKAKQLNDYISILVGIGITTVVQPSSVTTSPLTPLCGMSITPLEKLPPHEPGRQHRHPRHRTTTSLSSWGSAS